jgi:hypothetical protein
LAWIQVGKNASQRLLTGVFCRQALPAICFTIRFHFNTLERSLTADHRQGACKAMLSSTRLPRSMRLTLCS